MDALGQVVIALAVLALLWAVLVLVLIAAGRRSDAHELTTFVPNLVLLFRGLPAVVAYDGGALATVPT